MALDKAIPDGALYRIPISKDGTLSKPELILKNLYFANGFYIDEKRNKLYLSEMMKNRVLSFDLDIITGSVSNQTTLAVIPTPDNMELDSEGFYGFHHHYQIKFTQLIQKTVKLM